MSHRPRAYSPNAYMKQTLINIRSCLFVFFLKTKERINQTVEITKNTVDIEEKGVKLKLTIVDTPGFGDAVNNTEW